MAKGKSLAQASIRRTLLATLVAGLWSCGGGDDAAPARGFNTPAGTNVGVGLASASATFTNVTAPGTTTATAIADPSTVGALPGGYFSIAGATYDVTTTATYTGNITVCIPVPASVAFDNTVADNESMVAAVDAIIGEMRDDGTLLTLSQKWFDGKDRVTAQ